MCSVPSLVFDLRLIHSLTLFSLPVFFKQISPLQVSGLSALLDDKDVWMKRSRYGRFRPRGWLTAQEARILTSTISSSSPQNTLASSYSSAPSADTAESSVTSSCTSENPTQTPPTAGAGALSSQTVTTSACLAHKAAAASVFVVSWKEVWKYAIKAVLYDIRMQIHGTNAPMWVGWLVAWLILRLTNCQLLS
jgi:hypothetical protein